MSRSLTDSQVSAVRRIYEREGIDAAARAVSSYDGVVTDYFLAKDFVRRMAISGWSEPLAKSRPLTLTQTIKRRDRVQRRICDAISHLPVEQQLRIVMSWMSIADLESAVETIAGP